MSIYHKTVSCHILLKDGARPSITLSITINADDISINYTNIVHIAKLNGWVYGAKQPASEN